MKLKKIYYSLILSLLVVFPLAVKAESPSMPPVDYKGEVIVDSDLDGLTDQGEIQLYQTDAGNPDTDGDGYLDGAEILSATDPLYANDYPSHRLVDIENNRSALSKINAETPWAWYVARSAGIIGFVFLWLTVFLGLAIRNPLLKKIITPIYSFGLHCFLGALAVYWALIHGLSLLFDKYIGFGIKDIAVPFVSQGAYVDTNYLALGILAFYFMAIMAITSYLRRHLNHWVWRILHFLNPLAFVFAVIHGYANGTDMKNVYIGGLFLLSAAVLSIVYLTNLMALIINKLRRPVQTIPTAGVGNNQPIYGNQNNYPESTGENPADRRPEDFRTLKF